LADLARSFGVNTYSYTMSSSAVECVQRLADRGYGAFELMLYPGHLWPNADSAGELQALRRLVERRSLRIVSVNAPNIDINIAGAADEIRAYSLDLLSKIVRIAGGLGADGVVIGPGKANPLLPAPQEALVGHFHAALDRLAPIAEQCGTALWLENIPFAFLPDADSLMNVLDSYGSDRIGICYDVANGHFIGEDPCEGLRRVRERLKLVHVSDTGRAAYRHDAAGQGNVPFALVPPVLAEIVYGEVAMLEIVTQNPDRDIDETVRRLVELGWAGVRQPSPAS
jgi:L-ribulose-5-phosphate 3-epimerase